jgi:hypothetical protein
MAKWDITGKWVGEYSYHPGKAVPVLPPPVCFALDARLGWFGRLRGTIQDDPVGGPPEPASMVGWVWGTTVSFRKQYPRFYVIHEGELITLDEQLEITHGITLDESPAARPIWYRGRYDPENNIVRGIWRIEEGRLHLKTRGQVLVCALRGTSGEWSMQRLGD